jgi:hypothetical protein
MTSCNLSQILSDLKPYIGKHSVDEEIQDTSLLFDIYRHINLSSTMKLSLLPEISEHILS